MRNYFCKKWQDLKTSKTKHFSLKSNIKFSDNPNIVPLNTKPCVQKSVSCSKPKLLHHVAMVKGPQECARSDIVSCSPKKVIRPRPIMHIVVTPIVRINATKCTSFMLPNRHEDEDDNDGALMLMWIMHNNSTLLSPAKIDVDNKMEPTVRALFFVLPEVPENDSRGTCAQCSGTTPRKRNKFTKHPTGADRGRCHTILSKSRSNKIFLFSVRPVHGQFLVSNRGGRRPDVRHGKGVRGGGRRSSSLSHVLVQFRSCIGLGSLEAVANNSVVIGEERKESAFKQS